MLKDQRWNEGRYLDIFCSYKEIAHPGISEYVDSHPLRAFIVCMRLAKLL
jgi:hypothetical protein